MPPHQTPSCVYAVPWTHAKSIQSAGRRSAMRQNKPSVSMAQCRSTNTADPAWLSRRAGKRSRMLCLHRSAIKGNFKARRAQQEQAANCGDCGSDLSLHGGLRVRQRAASLCRPGQSSRHSTPCLQLSFPVSQYSSTNFCFSTKFVQLSNI